MRSGLRNYLVYRLWTRPVLNLCFVVSYEPVYVNIGAKLSYVGRSTSVWYIADDIFSYVFDHNKYYMEFKNGQIDSLKVFGINGELDYLRSTLEPTGCYFHIFIYKRYRWISVKMVNKRRIRVHLRTQTSTTWEFQTPCDHHQLFRLLAFIYKITDRL